MMTLQHVPNFLTFLRILTIPVIVITFYFDDAIFAHRLAAGLFLLASISDFLDGYIARRFNVITKLGKMLDPIADKLLISAILLMLAKFRKANEIPCLLILTREFFISGLREFLGELHISVPVSRLAKIKTTMQMIALFILLLGSKGSGIKVLDSVGQISLWLAAMLTLVTGYSYAKASIRYIIRKE